MHITFLPHGDRHKILDQEAGCHKKKGKIYVNEVRQRSQSRKGVNELPQVSSGQTKPTLRAEHTVRVHTIHVEATAKRLEFFRLKPVSACTAVSSLTPRPNSPSPVTLKKKEHLPKDVTSRVCVCVCVGGGGGGRESEYEREGGAGRECGGVAERASMRERGERESVCVCVCECARE